MAGTGRRPEPEEKVAPGWEGSNWTGPHEHRCRHCERHVVPCDDPKCCRTPYYLVCPNCEDQERKMLHKMKTKPLWPKKSRPPLSQEEFDKGREAIETLPAFWGLIP